MSVLVIHAAPSDYGCNIGHDRNYLKTTMSTVITVVYPGLTREGYVITVRSEILSGTGVAVMSQRWSVVPLVACLLAGASLAACGSDDGGGAASGEKASGSITVRA